MNWEEDKLVNKDQYKSQQSGVWDCQEQGEIL